MEIIDEAIEKMAENTLFIILLISSWIIGEMYIKDSFVDPSILTSFIGMILTFGLLFASLIIAFSLVIIIKRLFKK